MFQRDIGRRRRSSRRRRRDVSIIYSWVSLGNAPILIISTIEMNIIICCFKSCLKGENDREYYNVLELDPRCDHDSIRKQYRKLSLVNHPVRYYLNPF